MRAHRTAHADADTELFARHLSPLFERLEFEPAKWPQKPSVGETIRCVSRRVSAARTLFFVMWRKPQRNLRFAFYLHEGSTLAELHANMAVSQEATFSQHQGVPGITPDEAFAFLAGCIAYEVTRLTVLVPEFEISAALDLSQLVTAARAS